MDANTRLKLPENFFDTAALGIHFIEPDGTILDVNRAELEMLGYRREELRGRNAREFHLDPEPIEDLLSRIQAGRALRNQEARLRCKDGTVKHVLIDCHAAPSGSKLDHAICFVRDITDRKRAEERLREETRVAETLNHISGILTAELDLKRLVQTVTDEATSLTSGEYGALFYHVANPEGESYTLNALSGVSRASFGDYVSPRATTLLGATLREREVVRLDDVTEDPRYGTAPPHHGPPPGHPRVRSYLAAPIISRTGEILGGLFVGHSQAGVFTQRDERLLVGVASQAAVAIDNALLYQKTQESERRFHLLAETAPVMIWMSGPDRQNVYFNRHWLRFTGRTERQERGEGWLEGIHPDDLEAFQRTYSRAFEAHRDFRIEHRLRRRDGQFRWVLNIGAPRFTPDETFSGFIGSCIDITDRKTAEEDLRKANRRLAEEVRERARAEMALRTEQHFLRKLYEIQEKERQLVACDIHDGMVQYATGALMHLETHLDSLPPSSTPEEVQLTVQLLRKTVDEGRHLINGIRPPVLDEYGVGTAIEHLIHDQEASGRKIEFLRDPEADRFGPTLETAIYRIVQEALANALQHSGSDRVRIVLVPTDGQVRLEIEDWGVGFDPDQVPEDRHGLHGIRERVALLDGQLRVESKPGQGAKISVLLPVLGAEPEKD